MYGLRLTNTVQTPAPLDPAIVKKHCRVLHGKDDAYLTELSLSAMIAAEIATHRQLLTATAELTLDRFPICGDPIRLPFGTWQATNSVEYINNAGNEATWDSADYITINKQPAEIWPAIGKTWPITRLAAGVVVVSFDCGYGDDFKSIPPLLRHSMLLLVGHWYMNREATISESGVTPAELPFGVGDIFEKFALGDDFDDYQPAPWWQRYGFNSPADWFGQYAPR